MKLSNLVKLCKISCIFATVFSSLAWMKIVMFAFSKVHYVIEDNFIYIGVLGGWLFIQLFYLALIIAFGYYMQWLINKIYANVATGETEDKDGK